MDTAQVKKDLTLLIRQRKCQDTEGVRARKKNTIIAKFLTTLHDFKREVETLNILPGTIAQEIAGLIPKIESIRPEG